MSVAKSRQNLCPWFDELDFRGILYALEKRKSSEEAARVLLVLEAVTAQARDPGGSEYLERLDALRAVTGRYRWGVRVLATRKGLIERRAPDQEALSIPRSAWEYQTIGELVRLVPFPDTLKRLRKCLDCGGWFYAEKRADQIFCGRVCLQRHHQNDEGVKERKRATMRAAYLREKGRAERAKLAVQAGRLPARHTVSKKK